MSRTDPSVADDVLIWEEGPRRHADTRTNHQPGSLRRIRPTAPANRAPHYARPGAWRRAAFAWIAERSQRSDWQHSRGRVAGVLAQAAREDGSSAPTWDWIAEDTGLSRRTVARALADLVAAGWVVVVETGSTDVTRPSFSTMVGNRAAVYGLLIPTSAAPPAVSLTGTPLRTPYGRHPDSRARPRPDGRTAAASGGALTKKPAAAWPRMARTCSRHDELHAARALQDRVLVLRRLSDRSVRALARDWFRDGWTVEDLAWALDHDPDGQQRRWDTAVTHPIGWFRHRLAPHRGTTPRSSVLDDRRALEAAARNTLFADLARARDAAVGPDTVPAWSAARAAVAQLPRWRSW